MGNVGESAVGSEASEASTPRTSTTTMSLRYLGLDWSSALPWVFEDVSVETASYASIGSFMRDDYARVFGTDKANERFFAEPPSSAKLRFASEMDVFAFRHLGKTVGVVMGHPCDWSTYYFRTVAVMPEFRERGLLTRFMERTDGPLRAAGIDRVEGECSPANTPMVRMLSGQGYVVTATSTSERWGAMLRWTKFLSPEAEKAYRQQYVVAPPVTRRLSS